MTDQTPTTEASTSVTESAYDHVNEPPSNEPPDPAEQSNEMPSDAVLDPAHQVGEVSSDGVSDRREDDVAPSTAVTPSDDANDQQAPSDALPDSDEQSDEQSDERSDGQGDGEGRSDAVLDAGEQVGEVLSDGVSDRREDDVAPFDAVTSSVGGVDQDVVPGSAGRGGEQHEQVGIEVEGEEVIDDVTMRRALEAILMVTDEPLAAVTLARAVGRATNDVAEALTGLADEYADQGRGFELRKVAGGWRYYTREDAAPYVEKFVLDGQQARLTQAALETLAVIAYKQPVSRARVSAIRGVNVDGVVRTLVTRGLVEEAGTDTESQATLYRTTSYFLERMGMQSLEDLPELAPYLPEMEDVEEELTREAAPPETQPETEQPKDE